jgi:chitin disaccharide deacetylase
MGHDTSNRILIVNADDYGYTPGVSDGIRQAYRQGIVSSTSVMMTMEAAASELARLVRETPQLGVGVHLTVTEGRPFCLPRCLPPAALARALAATSSTLLRAEWQAQIEALRALGVSPTHLDSHHHAAYRHEKALTVLFELAREYGVPVRNPYPIGDAEADALAGAFAGAGVRHPQTFVDVFDEAPSGAALLRALAALSAGVTEMMCHPGLVDDELRQSSPTRAAVRAAELAALTDPAARGCLARLGIELVSFAALFAS